MVKSNDLADIVKKLKEQDSERTNFTFRLSKTLVGNFKKKCAREGVANSAVLEGLLRLFLSLKEK